MNIYSIPIPFFHTKKRKQGTRAQTLGWLFLGFMIFASSTNPAFAKQLTTAFAPLSMLFLSEIMIGSFNILSFGFIPIIKKMVHLRKAQLIPLIIMGLTNGVIGPLLWFTGLHKTTAVNGELFGRTEMVFIIVLSVIFLHEKLKRIHIMAGAIILFGVIVVGMRGFENGINIQSGDIFILASAVVYAVGGILIKKYLYKLHPEVLIFSRSGMALMSFFLISPFVQHTLIDDVLSFPMALIWVLLGYGFVSRFLGVFSFYQSIERLPVTTVSLFATLSIVGSVLLSNLYLGESLYWYHAIGLGLIILGVILMQLDGIHLSEKHLLSHMKVSHRHHL